MGIGIDPALPWKWQRRDHGVVKVQVQDCPCSYCRSLPGTRIIYAGIPSRAAAGTLFDTQEEAETNGRDE